MKYRFKYQQLIRQLVVIIWIPFLTTGQALPPTDKHEQQKILLEWERRCNESIYNNQNVKTGYCPALWDRLLCWDSVPAGTISSQKCPHYISGFNSSNYAYKNCTSNGTWYVNEKNVAWTNFSSCSSLSNVTNSAAIMKEHLERIKLMRTIGYAMSLQALIIAFCLLLCMKKLRCTRNTLHMHLFVSFILRSSMCLIKDGVFVDSLAFPHQYDIVKSHQSVNLTSNVTLDDLVWCKLVTSIWHYCLLANYFWILVEGLYLHNLIFLATFAESKGKRWYFVLGWVVPILVIISWALARYYLENVICWSNNENASIFWIIRGPITVTIVINFIFFVNIVRVLSAKLKTSNAAQARKFRYRKLAKSTLVLVPLFGIHYMLTIGLSVEKTEIDLLIWLYIEQFFNSFQGLFVAVLYCFLNGEVQSEIRKKWQRWKLRQGNSVRSRNSFFTQSLSYFSKGGNSLPSIHSSSEKRDSLTNCNSRPASPTSTVCNGKTVYEMKDKENASLYENLPILDESESKV